MCNPRMGSLAAPLPNGQILIAGGSSDSRPWITNSAEIYDPLADAFRLTGPMTLSRGYLPTTQITLLNGKVLVIGGSGLNSNAIAELYDPRMGTFARTGRMNVPRDSSAAALLEDGRVLVTGGMPTALPALPRIAMARSTAPVESAELYDPVTGTFTATGNILSSRARHAAIRMHDGRVLIVGGMDSPIEMTNVHYLSSAELYDPATGAFSATGSTHVPRTIAVLLNDGRVLVTGPGQIAPSLEIYDPSAGKFGLPIPLPEGPATATVLKDGKVLLTGMQSSLPAELFDPSTGTLVPTAATVSPCPGNATLLKSGDVLFNGGHNCEARQALLSRQIQRSVGQMHAVGESPSVPSSAELFHEKRR